MAISGNLVSVANANHLNRYEREVEDICGGLDYRQVSRIQLPIEVATAALAFTGIHDDGILCSLRLCAAVERSSVYVCDISVPHVQRFSGCFNDTHGKVQGTQSRSTAKWLRTRHKTSMIAPDSREDARLRTLS